MNRPALIRDEKELLRNHFSKSPIPLIRLKAQALLMVDEGLKQAQVGRFILRRPRTIQLWLRDFKERRMASLFSGHLDNQNAGKLTREQKEEIAKVLKQPPSVYGLPREFWDVPQLKEYVKASFGVEYESDQSYHFLLRFGGLSFKYPDRVSPRREEAFIFDRLRAIRREIKPYLNDEGWQVFAADETAIQLEVEIRRAWLRCGERTVVSTERSRERQNYLGFLDQKTGHCQVHQTERGNQKETIRVLKILLKQFPLHEVCVVWDNARWHKGKRLRNELSKGRSLQRLHLVNFQPYAPETNPVEHVWQYAKQQMANRQPSEFSRIKTAFRSVTDSRSFNYKI